MSRTERIPGGCEYVAWETQPPVRRARKPRSAPAVAAAAAAAAAAATAGALPRLPLFVASNDRCCFSLKVNGVLVSGFAPELTMFGLSRTQDAKRRLLAAPGFYATDRLGLSTHDRVAGVLRDVRHAPSAGSLAYATHDELNADADGVLAVLDQLFCAFETEVAALGHTGVISDARVRKSVRSDMDTNTPEPYLQFHVDPPIVGPMFTWAFLRKFGGRPVPLDERSRSALETCRTALPVLDRLLLEQTFPSLHALLAAAPELQRHGLATEGFTYQTNLRVAQNLLVDAPPGADLAGLKRRAVTGHVGGHLNCWLQLNDSVARYKTINCRPTGEPSAAQPTLAFIPKKWTGRVLRACSQQDPFAEAATKSVAEALRDLIGTSGLHFFPHNSCGRALVWDGQQALHSAIYYHPLGLDQPAVVEDTRSSLEMRYTTLTQTEIQEYQRGILQEMCAQYLLHLQRKGPL
eukprot:SAG31_NODE_15_length_37942_cov_32.078297_2_plen_464_part_00